MGGAGGVPTWVAWVTWAACLRGWCGKRASVSNMLAWIAWMAC